MAWQSFQVPGLSPIVNESGQVIAYQNADGGLVDMEQYQNLQVGGYQGAMQAAFKANENDPEARAFMEQQYQRSKLPALGVPFEAYIHPERYPQFARAATDGWGWLTGADKEGREGLGITLGIALGGALAQFGAFGVDPTPATNAAGVSSGAGAGGGAGGVAAAGGASPFSAAEIAQAAGNAGAAAGAGVSGASLGLPAVHEAAQLAALDAALGGGAAGAVASTINPGPDAATPPTPAQPPASPPATPTVTPPAGPILDKIANKAIDVGLNLATGALINAATGGSGTPDNRAGDIAGLNANVNAAAANLETPEEAAARAHGDVSQAFGTARGNINRTLTGYGLNPGSDKFASANFRLGLEEAKADANSQNIARRTARDAAFGRATDLARVSSALIGQQAGLDAADYTRRVQQQAQYRAGLAPLVSAASDSVRGWFGLGNATAPGSQSGYRPQPAMGEWDTELGISGP